MTECFLYFPVLGNKWYSILNAHIKFKPNINQYSPEQLRLLRWIHPYIMSPRAIKAKE